MTTEHPELTIGQLCNQIKNPAGPIRRSAHVGNQPPHELLLMTAMPKGIEVVLVDTIQGNDGYYEGSPPKLVRLASSEPIPLCRKKGTTGRVVGSIPIDESCLPKNHQLRCFPQAGESLADFHARAINQLEPANRPTLMTEFFARHAELFKATMTACQSVGEVTRMVGPDGLIEDAGQIDLEGQGIFGLTDTTPNNQGAMIPLNGMMALDMAISQHIDGSDKTTHLGGRHMVEYTQDRRRMTRVEDILHKVAAEIGAPANAHCYEVVNITGLASLVGSETHASQHQLLIAGNPAIDLEAFADQPCSGL